MATSKAEQYLGLCAAGRRITLGTEQVMREIRRHPEKVYLVVVASDASERTKKQLADKCAYYRRKLLTLNADMFSIARAVGKQAPVAAAAVMNRGLAAKIAESVSPDETSISSQQI